VPPPFRIGVVADSHVGEYLERIPDEALAALSGSDLILHAGDLSVPSVLEELADIAPVVAVRGDHDPPGTGLPTDVVLRVAGKRIGLTHGNRAGVIDGSVIAVDVIAGRHVGWTAGLERAMARRLGRVDCVVFGHWHRPIIGRVADTLCFSPGALCPWGSLEGGAHPRRGLDGIADRGVRRYRWQLGPDAMRPRIGMLHVHSGGIEATSIPLQRDASARVATSHEEASR
jgi:putative phosphoesterase